MCINDLNDLFRIIKLNKDEYSRYITVFNALIESEYGSSLNGFSNAHIKFHGNYNGVEFNQDIKIGVEKSQSNISKDFLNYFNFQNVIYIDSPSILENNHPSSQYHLRVLERKLKKIKNPDEIYSDEFFKDLNDFKRRIDELIGGNFEYVPSEDVFIFKKYDETFSMENTASGLKQLATIQLLLDNNELTKNSFLILDEPEINLHSEWQVKLAKLLVLLVKELNIYLYINSHSPQFIEALEVFSVKYGIINESKFYLSKKLDNNKLLLIGDIDDQKIYEYDILNKKITPVYTFLFKRALESYFRLRPVIIDNKQMIIFGGLKNEYNPGLFNTSYKVSNKAEIINLQTYKSKLQNMHYIHAGNQNLILDDGRILIYGGINNELYIPKGYQVSKEYSYANSKY